MHRVRKLWHCTSDAQGPSVAYFKNPLHTVNCVEFHFSEISTAYMHGHQILLTDCPQTD